jgi:hypothetical protein
MQVNQRNGTANPAGSPKITGGALRRGYDKTPFENFEGLAAKLLKVPKEEVDEKRAEQENARKQD